MVQFGDHFGSVADKYAQFRPVYPDSVYNEILAFAGEGRRDLAIDIGTGSGQAAVPLTKWFTKVIGYDASPGQLAKAVPTENLEFRQSPAEKIDLPSGSVDLIIAAQAVHWFDFPTFFPECYRLLRPEGTLALFGYDTARFPDEDEEADRIFLDFYENVIGVKYWPYSRRYLDDHYEDIRPSPPFPPETRKTLVMHKEVDMDGFLGYVSTWSGVKEYREQTKTDPLPELHKKLMATSLANRTWKLTFPVFLILAKKLL